MIANLVGECVKVWLVYPATGRNLLEYAKTSGLSHRLARCGARLEGGILIRQNSGIAIILPPCALHAVFTLRGGFVVNSTFSLIEGLVTMAQLICIHYINYPR